MGPARRDASPKGDRNAGRSRGDFRYQRSRKVDFPVARKAHLFTGGNCIPGTDVETSQTKALGGGHGPGATTYFREDDEIHRNTASPARIPFAHVLP